MRGHPARRHSASPVAGRSGAPDTVVLALAALVAVTGVAATASRGLVQGGTALAFALLVALGETARVRLPGDRVAAPVSVAAALGYTLLVAIGGTPAGHDALQVIAVVAVAGTVGALPHAVTGRLGGLHDSARRLLVTAVAAFVFRPFAGGLTGHAWEQLVLSVAVTVVAGMLDALLSASVQAGRDGLPLLPTLRNEVRALVGLGAAIASTGVLIALAAAPLRLWALPIFSVPLLVTQFSFRRYAAIRTTYLQTIRALSRVTEVGGYVETGHSRRVSRLAVAVGRDLGLTDADLLDLEYAALMHDIGQLSFADPVPGGSTLLVTAAERRRIAELGAEIVRSAGALGRVADVIERQADPYRRAQERADASLPLASRIIKVANAFDDLVGTRPDTDARAHAFEHLRLGMAFDYDPRVVEALARIDARRPLVAA